MSCLPTSSLVFFSLFFFSNHLSWASTKKELGWCEAMFECGNITAGFPFSGGSRPHYCGHPSLELQCFNNKTSIIISDHLYDVLHIDQTSKTLRLVRAELGGYFCTATFTTTTFPPEIFELSTTSQSLTVFYLCDHNFSYSSSYTCPDRGPVSVSQNLDYHKYCQDSFTINVPKSYVPEEKDLDLKRLENALHEGFDVKVKIDEQTCEECLFSQGICGFNNTTQICCKNDSSSRCNTLHIPRIDELHQRCSGPFSCGNKEELLFYPFWRSGRENCGHPDFKLDCSGEFPELDMSSVKYRILSMSYEDSPVIRLARSDYIGNLCPPDPRNASLSESILQLVRDTDLLTLYYDCNVLPPASAGSYIGTFGCGYEGHRTSYYVTRNLSSPLLKGISDLLDNFTTLCRRNVSIPVSRQALNKLEESPSQDNLKNALDHGFELGVNNDCSQCIESRGACGYSQNSRSFICYCVDKPHSRTCRDTGLSTAAKAGIGSAVGLVGVILIAMGLFCLYRRRRKTQSDQYTSKDLPVTSYSSRETSSYPTSTTISSSSNHSLLPSISNLRNGSTYFGVQVFSYEELEEATHNFSRELGDGGFGTVYYGMLKDGRAVAVKRLYERSLKRVEQFKNEIEILKSLKHRNLVILYGCTSRHSRELLLVYEYISNGTLADHLHGDRAQPRPLCWPVRLNVAIETASALSFLHKSGIIHRDVKTTNILLDDEYTVKVADFGLSRLFPMDQTHISTAPQGTPGYVDPEYYQCYRLNEKSDVYSFGVVLTELISSKEAVDITRHRHDINLANMAVSKIQNNALHELVDPSLGFAKDPEVKRKMMAVAELAFRCLQQEREVRPSMDEIVEILKGIKGENRVESSPDVVDIERSGGDDVGLLRHCHSVPPPISPETDKWTSSSDTAASSF
ncbi:PREDICTED: probable serine/threonine-protein kinase At1g18390 isoform X1 [Brassica oleracea var. oleracea]|uniref:probable serine/threonine-protein kinase At1g18390 isoform X1 n=1 Tax=Brassica oleracea var. oleracea TaxID=109376 RepID=UPI0006A6AC5B|nr:PREDICTED: probable serine/threonine-protein kinase At1g18390 isoform X1 [Brassica oleracea var. oleracea]